jgi:di/tripeptidase
MADYWEQVDKGQPKGTIVKVADLEKWLAVKKIAIATKPNQTKQQAIRSFATAIAAKIKAKGTIKRFGYKGGSGCC